MIQRVLSIILYSVVRVKPNEPKGKHASDLHLLPHPIQNTLLTNFKLVKKILNLALNLNFGKRGQIVKVFTSCVKTYLKVITLIK